MRPATTTSNELTGEREKIWRETPKQGMPEAPEERRRQTIEEAEADFQTEETTCFVSRPKRLLVLFSQGSQSSPAKASKRARRVLKPRQRTKKKERAKTSFKFIDLDEFL